MNPKSPHPNLLDPSEKNLHLIPNSGIQFLDYALDTDACRRLRERFFDEPRPERPVEGGTVVPFWVHPMRDEPRDEESSGLDEATYRSVLADGPTGVETDQTYQVSGVQALRMFDRQWMPVPFYRLKIEPGQFADGPTNWSRAYLRLPDGDGEPARLVLAFDTELLERESGDPYVGPEPADAKDPEIRFGWMSSMADQATYIANDWRRDWVKAAYLDGLASINPRRADESLFAALGEPYANYIVYLQCLQAMLDMPVIELTDTVTDAELANTSRNRGVRQHLDVDLVLDIGNSRTCGMLVEQGIEDEGVNMGQPPARLELRNLTHPERLTNEPFESRVEFQPAELGRRGFGRRANRRGGVDAFWWPSPVRTGPEAVDLAAMSDGRDGVSGMSSPKRYLWDLERRPENWSNNRAGRPAEQRIPPIRGPIPHLLTDDGRPRSPEKVPSAEVRYSRGSMYMLLLVEILCHAQVQINSVAYRNRRANKTLMRRLRNIFITLPSATPLAERKRMEDHARKAIRLLASVFGWSKDSWQHPIPTLHLNWDEATCTQLVYLYDELEHRAQREPTEFFRAISRRPSSGEAPALRIASLDIGGGTSDLMIIEHVAHDEIVVPRQLFREGFRQAGDDIVKKVIELAVLPSIISAVRAAGVGHAAELVSYLFSGDTVDISRPAQIRRACFVNQVFIPVALRLMREYEKTDPRREGAPVSLTIDDCLSDDSDTQVVEGYLAQAVAERGGQGFSLRDITVVMDVAELAGAVKSVLGQILDDVADVVRAYECDVMLVTGRPSGLPIVQDILRRSGAVPAHRIISMYGYRIGNWYPFRSDDSRIWDPKTTASVGAWLCHVCQGKFAGFVFESKQLRIESTARYVGRMDQHGRIAADDVLFESDSAGGDEPAEFNARLGSRLDIGYRQLPIARWVTSQIYHAFYLTDELARDTPKPVTLTLERDMSNEAAFDEDALDDSYRESFTLVSAEDANGVPCGNRIGFRLQTFRTIDKLEAGYWLDTGVLSTGEVLDQQS